MSKYLKWKSPTEIPAAPEVVVLTQYAPGPTTTEKTVCYYQGGQYYDVATSQLITAPIVAWAPLPAV